VFIVIAVVTGSIAVLYQTQKEEEKAKRTAARQAASHSRLVDATHHNALDNSLSTDL